MALRRCGGEEVGRGAGRRGRVVDGADLGHPFVVERLAAGQPGFGLGARPCAPAGGGGTQRVGAHHDPLAVGREHQQIAALSTRRAARRIEVLEVDCAQRREFFDLAFAQPLPGLALDRFQRVLEATAGRLQGGELAQPVRMTFDREVQRRVGGMQVRDPGRPVRQPFDRHGAEHRLQGAGVACLDAAARHALIADDILNACLANPAQRQMVIQQPPQQLTPVTVKALLELRMREVGGVAPVQEAHQRLELLPTPTKPSPYRPIARRTGAAAPTSHCIIATNLPARQDFGARGVKFATTGVEIGGHVGHLRGRRWTSATPTSTPDL